MLPTTYNRRRNREWFPSIFNEFFNDDFMGFTPAKQFASPAVNVIEDDKQYTLELAAPGMTRNDFCVRLENDNELVIGLQKKEEKTDDTQNDRKRNYLRREFSYASYRQTFLIPDDVNVEGISAAMADGILTVALPKKEEAVKTPASRQIAIG